MYCDCKFHECRKVYVATELVVKTLQFLIDLWLMLVANLMLHYSLKIIPDSVHRVHNLTLFQYRAQYN